MARQCPDDRTTLEQKTINAIQVDICPKCGGIWLDQGEIARVRKLTTDQIKEFETKPNPLPSRSTNPACPVCSKILQPFKYAGGNAMLESCPDLHGIWVPETEMDKIAAMQNVAWQAQIVLNQETGNSEERAFKLGRAAQALQGMSMHIGWPFIPVEQPLDYKDEETLDPPIHYKT